MVAVLVVIMIIGGLSGTMLMQAMGGQRSTNRTVEASKLLFVSEAGLDYNFVKMSQDPLYAVTNLAFQLDGTDQSYVSPTLTLDAGATQQSFQYRIQYLLAETPVVFADRSDPIDAGEDTNGNGRLDADWNLTPTSVTFNRRLPDLTYSLPITFRLTDDKIEHVVQTDPGGASITTAIARRVTEFDISEGTSMVTITLGITIPVSEEDNISRSQSVNVTPRN